MQEEMSNSQSVLSWMASERLYEEYLFFYILIIVFWGAVGLFSFGFELSGYSLQQNLFFNFIWFLILAFAMAYTPFWYRLVFGSKARLQRRSEEIHQKIEKIEDPIKREAIKQHIANDGGLPPRKLQKWSLIFLGWCALFELFFISAWVKDLTLIWQPFWIQWIIDWMTANLNLPPLNIDRKFFLLDLEGSVFEKQFVNEQAFLASPLGDVALVFQFWRALIFFPILTALIILLWKPIDWLGMTRLDPRYINGVGKFLWCSVISLFMPIFLWGGVLGLLQVTDSLVLMALSKSMWLENFYLNAMFILIIFSLKIFVGWLHFWQRIFHHKSH
ncbi:MAG: hypothetical protein E6Q26_04560 [Acinetobacter sp.]|nr:MAG: hypothetical protein E6Q26_04560 [Acinetobacter sp.]